MSLFSGVFSLPVLFKFCQVCLLVKETAEIETGMEEKSTWDQANIRQKLGLVWRNRKKICQIIKDYMHTYLHCCVTELWRWEECWLRSNRCDNTAVGQHTPTFYITGGGGG
jgi:hypothetical protein